jgi:hypothetical protein
MDMSSPAASSGFSEASAKAMKPRDAVTKLLQGFDIHSRLHVLQGALFGPRAK